MKKIATINNIFNKAYSKTQIRKSSRAIIIKNDLILMIHSTKNDDFKFPGGGRKVFESPIDNLIRETKEETGYDIIKASIKPLGYVEELNKASNNKNVLFKMISEYYFVILNPIMTFHFLMIMKKIRLSSGVCESKLCIKNE